ncbi:hypothetical protein PL9214650207 [Planktothrix tepida PCC 9214]|uniref:Uncharacterized protein n=1 Tax=Planktothrix tepida PCC 9214 TaxID=671072 RepID=A0A1J1LQB0_9CYAN|nr:hypothetical protein PL9214650207 [Planktothrix tepida PCC 9214]
MSAGIYQETLAEAIHDFREFKNLAVSGKFVSTDTVSHR